MQLWGLDSSGAQHCSVAAPVKRYRNFRFHRRRETWLVGQLPAPLCSRVSEVSNPVFLFKKGSDSYDIDISWALAKIVPLEATSVVLTPTTDNTSWQQQKRLRWEKRYAPLNESLQNSVTWLIFKNKHKTIFTLPLDGDNGCTLQGHVKPGATTDYMHSVI